MDKFKIVDGMVYPICENGHSMECRDVLDCLPPYYSHYCLKKECKAHFGSDKAFPLTIEEFLRYRTRQLSMQRYEWFGKIKSVF